MVACLHCGPFPFANIDVDILLSNKAWAPYRDHCKSGAHKPNGGGGAPSLVTPYRLGESRWAKCGAPNPLDSSIHANTLLSAWFYHLTLGLRLPIYVWIVWCVALVPLWPFPLQRHRFQHGFTKLLGPPLPTYVWIMLGLPWSPCEPFPIQRYRFQHGFTTLLRAPLPIYVRIMSCLPWYPCGPFPYKDIGFSTVLPHYWGLPYRSMYGLCRVCLGPFVALSPTKTSVSAWFYHIGSLGHHWRGIEKTISHYVG